MARVWRRGTSNIPPRQAGKDKRAAVFMGSLFVGLPVVVSLIKGMEKRIMWHEAPAVIEEVQTTKTHQTIRYRYAARNKVFVHTQRDYVELPLLSPYVRFNNYMVGDRVAVRVHSRNEKLSVLDPPVFARIWRDFKKPSPYEGQQVKV